MRLGEGGFPLSSAARSQREPRLQRQPRPRSQLRALLLPRGGGHSVANGGAMTSRGALEPLRVLPPSGGRCRSALPALGVTWARPPRFSGAGRRGGGRGGPGGGGGQDAEPPAGAAEGGGDAAAGEGGTARAAHPAQGRWHRAGAALRERGGPFFCRAALRCGRPTSALLPRRGERMPGAGSASFLRGRPAVTASPWRPFVRRWRSSRCSP